MEYPKYKIPTHPELNVVQELIKPTLTQNASIYVCSDWKTSVVIAPVLEGPDEFLKDFRGTICGDCYSGYVNIEDVTNGRIAFFVVLVKLQR